MIRIPVSRFRAELKRWLESAQAGEEIVVTDHGRPVVRVVGAGRLTTFERLVNDGVIRPARTPKRTVAGRPKIKPKRPISDLVSKQRD